MWGEPPVTTSWIQYTLNPSLAMRHLTAYMSVIATCIVLCDLWTDSRLEAVMTEDFRWNKAVQECSVYSVRAMETMGLKPWVMGDAQKGNGDD